MPFTTDFADYAVLKPVLSHPCHPCNPWLNLMQEPYRDKNFRSDLKLGLFCVFRAFSRLNKNRSQPSNLAQRIWEEFFTTDSTDYADLKPLLSHPCHPCDPWLNLMQERL
jgi:hypothetical protein